MPSGISDVLDGAEVVALLVVAGVLGLWPGGLSLLVAFEDALLISVEAGDSIL